MAEPWVRYEDEHLLVVAKPAGVNTHRADFRSQDGMHEWVQRQRPGTSLSVLHRLDKTTSGLLLFGKSTEANRSLAAQFEEHRVRKTYELLARRGGGSVPSTSLSCREPIDGRPAETDFEASETGPRLQRYEARPASGRTHQVRVHAAALGLPVVGDERYGGDAAARVFLHAAALGIDHPVTGPLEIAEPRPASFDQAMAAADPSALTSAALAAAVAHEARATLFDPAATDAYLWIDRNPDAFPDLPVERLGEIGRAAGRENVCQNV